MGIYQTYVFDIHVDEYVLYKFVPRWTKFKFDTINDIMKYISLFKGIIFYGGL